MRYPASEKLEIIRLVEQSHLGSGPLWTSWALRRPPFIAGTIAFWPLATPVLRIATAAQAGCGTVSRMMSGADHRSCPGGDATVAPGTGRQVYAHQGLLCLASLGLPASQGPRPDHQPRFRGHQGSR